MTHTTGCYYSL